MAGGGSIVPVCKSKTLKNEPCRAHAVSKSRLCFFHDSKLRESRLEAQKSGGRKRNRPLISQSPRAFDLSKPRDILEMLTYAANGLVNGQLDFKIAHAFGHLADSAIRAYPAGVLADGQARLERLAQVAQIQPFDPINQASPLVFEEAAPTEPETGSKEQVNGGPR
jgi:hypothetical protein